jgi:lysophospholipase L1-like esterase
VPPTKPSALRRLDGLAAAVPGAADLVVLGDSLAAAWPSADLLAARPGSVPFNFGLPGDRIQHTLWRLDAVATGHLRPRVVLVVLGTNNLGDGDAPASIVAGWRAVLGRVGALWSPPMVVGVGLPWRRPETGTGEGDRRAANSGLAGLLAETGGAWLDPDPVLGGDAATTGETVSSDGLHLTPVAYRRLSAALATLLTRDLA